MLTPSSTSSSLQCKFFVFLDQALGCMDVKKHLEIIGLGFVNYYIPKSA